MDQTVHHLADSSFEVMKCFLLEFYHLSIQKIDDIQTLTDFLEKNRIHSAQVLFHAESLLPFLSIADSDTIYDLTDPFLLHLILFWLKGVPVILGPFSTVTLSASDARLLLQRQGLSEVSSQDFLAYLSSFPLLRESEIYRMITAFIRVVQPEEPQKTIQKHAFSDKGTVFSPEEATQRNQYTELLEKRYAYEQAFLRDIEKGNSRSAIFNLNNMHMDVAYLKRIGTTLENERIGAAITRTTVRIAALQAGLPPILVDRLSAKNTAVTHQAKTVDEILTAKENMVRDFCRAIHECRQSGYSALVQSARYYFDHEYYRPISLEELCEELQVSENHLISQFRKETGVTPIVYLRNVRMNRAAALLFGTDLSIQEISNSVGILDGNYFVKLFKKVYGEAPSAYRKRHKIL